MQEQRKREGWGRCIRGLADFLKGAKQECRLIEKQKQVIIMEFELRNWPVMSPQSYSRTERGLVGTEEVSVHSVLQQQFSPNNYISHKADNVLI